MNDEATTRSFTPRMKSFVSVASICALAAVLTAGPFAGSNGYLHAAPVFEGAAARHPTGFADIVARVKPAVISVRVKIEKFPSSNESDGQTPNGWPFDQFFRQFGVPNNQQGPEVVTGQGSGFFISADGYAVTNYHVVDHASEVHVTTEDGKMYDAKVVGVDEQTDVALIKVNGRNDLPFVAFSDVEPRVGDWVLAVGNPFGLSETVTAGIVSARGRNIGAGPYDQFIQIDAPINKGNSGGPAFNVDGAVIGVNSAIVSPSGGSVGIGFAIPATTVKQVVEQLKEHGKVTRGWMGVEVQNITPDIADSLDLKDAQGALVAKLRSGSPADKAGIEPGDVVAAINGTPVKNAHDLAMMISALAPGASAKVQIVHHGETKSVTVTLGELPPLQEALANRATPPEADMRGLGLALAPAASVKGAGDQGVVVTWVNPAGVSADHGVQTGDVILDVGGKSVSTPSDVRKALGEARGQGKRSALLRLKSSNGVRFVALPVGKSYFGG